MLRLCYKGNFQKYVEVINVPSELYDKVKYQLSPYIVEDDGISDYKIIANKDSDNNSKTTDNILTINYSDDKYLLKTLRRSIRDALYIDYLKDGFVKMHASSITDGEDSYIIIGNKRTGKTSTALGFCKYHDFSLIDGDLTLIKNIDILGWSTPIGTREKTTEILNIGSHGLSEMKWLWPEDYKKLGFSIGLSGRIKKVIINKYDFNKKNIEFRKVSPCEKKQIFLNNIHYDEIDKENYWNVDSTDIEKCKMNILSSELLNIDMIECTSNGLNKDNIDLLYKELKK